MEKEIEMVQNAPQIQNVNSRVAQVWHLWECGSSVFSSHQKQQRRSCQTLRSSCRKVGAEVGIDLRMPQRTHWGVKPAGLPALVQSRGAPTPVAHSRKARRG